MLSFRSVSSTAPRHHHTIARPPCSSHLSLLLSPSQVVRPTLAASPLSASNALRVAAPRAFRSMATEAAKAEYDLVVIGGG